MFGHICAETLGDVFFCHNVSIYMKTNFKLELKKKGLRINNKLYLVSS